MGRCTNCLLVSLIIWGVIYAVLVQTSITAVSPPSVEERKALTALIAEDGGRSFVQPSGRVTEYFECGDGESSKVLVLLHGAFTSGKSGCELAASTAQALGLRMLSPSLPGWGLSSPSGKADINEFASDLQHLLDHLQVKEFGLAAISMGSPVAVSVLGALPKRVSSLLLMVPAAFDPRDGAQDYGWFRYLLTVYVMPGFHLWDVMVHYIMAPAIRSSSDPVGIFRNTLSPEELARSDETTLQIIGKDSQRSVKQFSRGASSMLTSLAKFNISTKYQPPATTIIVSGIDDDIVPINVGPMYEKLLPGSRLVREPGGHLSVGSQLPKYMPMLFPKI